MRRADGGDRALLLEDDEPLSLELSDDEPLESEPELERDEDLSLMAAAKIFADRFLFDLRAKQLAI